MRDQKVDRASSLPAPSRRRCCHRVRRGQSPPANGRGGRLGLSCDGCAQPTGRASRRAPDLHPTTVSRRSKRDRRVSSVVPFTRQAHWQCTLGDLRLTCTGAHELSTFSLLLDTVVRWVEAARAYLRVFVRSEAVVVWILGTGGRMPPRRRRGEAAPVRPVAASPKA